jgi:hypothetical protein
MKLFRNPEEGQGSQRAVMPVMMMMNILKLYVTEMQHFNMLKKDMLQYCRNHDSLVTGVTGYRVSH